MSISSGPKSVPTEGLQLYVDAANPESYPGSGADWYDLSGNDYHGSIVGSLSNTYYDNTARAIHFSGVSGNYLDIPGPDLRSSSFTVIGASRYTSSSGRFRLISAKDNNWLLGHWGGGSNKYFANGWVSTLGGVDTNWHIYVGTGHLPTDTYKFWRDNALLVSNNGGSQGPGGFRLGRYTFGSEYGIGDVAFIMAYNRVLEDSELSQVFQTFRSRFDI